MSAWPTAQLGDVAEIQRTSVSPEAIRTGTRYVGLEHISRDGNFNDPPLVSAGELASAKFAFDDSHVLYGKLRPNLGKVARPNFNGVCSTDILPIRSGSRLDRDYLHHFLRQPKVIAFAASQASGANLPRLSSGLLAKFLIPMPVLAEQRRIANILDRAETLRAQRRKALAQLDALAESIFLDMFGDPRAPPDGWPLKTIGELLESASYGTSEKAGATGQFPVLRMGNITSSGDLDLTNLKYMNLATAFQERYLARKGDVLFNRTNSAELVGKTALVRTDTPLAYAGYLIRLRANTSNDSEYLAAFLNSKYAKRMLRSMCKSIIGMANINAAEVQAMQIAQPPLAHQRLFARRVEKVEAEKSKHRQSLVQLDTLFASLQHRAFRGEL